VGSRQAGSQLPLRWAHLWVPQGRSGVDPLESGGDAYDLESLLDQLESGGAAVLQSPRDQQVAAALEEALAENFSQRGVRKNSPLWLRQQRAEETRHALREAEERLAATEGAAEELAAIEARLRQRRQEELPQLVLRRGAAVEAAEQAAALRRAIEQQRQALEPRRLRLEGLIAIRREMEQAAERVSVLERQQAEAAAARQRLQQQWGDLERRRAEAEAAHRRLEAQRQAITERGMLLQKLVEQARCREDLARLQGDLARQQRQAAALDKIATELQGLAPVGEAELRRLRQLETTVRQAEARLEALAAGVELVRADRPVWLGGVPLEPGSERRVEEVTELDLGEGVLVRIRPGGGTALPEGRARLERSRAELAAVLAQLGAASLEVAEAAARRRTELEQQRRVLQGTVPAAADDELLRQLQRGEARSRELEEELAALAAVRQDLEAEAPLPGEREELEQRHRGLQATWSATNAALRTCAAELAAATADLERLREEAGGSETRLAELGAELATRREGLAGLRQEHGEPAALAAAERQLQQELAGGAGAIREQEAQLAAMAADAAGLDPAVLETRIQQLEEECRGLTAELGAARQRVASLSAGDPHAALERARGVAEEAAEELATIERLVEAQQLLRDLFASARADLSQRYSGPLARAVEHYLAPLLPPGAACQLEYDATKGFCGLRLRRGGETYGFAELSGGMREQLAAALRLAMADVLRGGHDGCLPLIFDDAFTNSDPQRIEVVKRMLAMAVERGLQVIVLSCDPEAYGDVAGTTHRLPDAAVG
jgi:DNA repair exonuclease SbcCD ATPase subunit